MNKNLWGNRKWEDFALKLLCFRHLISDSQFIASRLLVTYFDMTMHEIKFTELNEVSKEFIRIKLQSKGFFPEAIVQDFPIRGKNVFLHITRRRWLNEPNAIEEIHFTPGTPFYIRWKISVTF